ncbi:hypothetical protein DXG01_016914 [Tephrocybe rancida]|nr:hypothetical protein DXG01_016914 [Tephrocybe rancida]
MASTHFAIEEEDYYSGMPGFITTELPSSNISGRPSEGPTQRDGVQLAHEDRTQARRHPNDHRRMVLPDLDNNLNRDLVNRRTLKVDGLIGQLYGEELEVLLGHPIDYCWIAHFQHVFTNLSLGPLLEDDGSLPDLSTFTEDKLCEYLNAIICSFHRYNYTCGQAPYNISATEFPRCEALREPLRYWNADYCGTVLKNDTGISVKPDIILVDLVNGTMKMNEEQITWRNVYSVGETLLYDHTTRAHLINRLRLDPPLVTAVRPKLPRPWLDVSHSMANVPVKYISKPLTFDIVPENLSGITHITVSDQVYRIHQELFSAQTLVGRGTRVWLAEDVSTAVMVIIKDSWILPSQVDEADFISELNGLPHTPTLVTKWGGPSTTDVRPPRAARDPERRDKRRLVTTPHASPFETFTSILEICSAVFDTVSVIDGLERQNKAHRDISFSNILFVQFKETDDIVMGPITTPPTTSFDGSETNPALTEAPTPTPTHSKEVSVALPIPTPEAVDQHEEDIEDTLEVREKLKHRVDIIRQRYHCRSAMVIDFDYAGYANQHDPRIEPTFSKGGRTGTAPFMAIDLLFHGASHKVRYDLESLFYVLLYVCTNWERPGVVRTQLGIFRARNASLLQQNQPRAALSSWFTTSTAFRDLAFMKLGILHFSFNLILHEMSPYFQPLFPYLKRMYLLLFGSPRDLKGQFEATPLNVMKLFALAMEDLQIQKARSTDILSPSYPMGPPAIESSSDRKRKSGWANNTAQANSAGRSVRQKSSEEQTRSQDTQQRQRSSEGSPLPSLGPDFTAVSRLRVHTQGTQEPAATLDIQPTIPRLTGYIPMDDDDDDDGEDNSDIAQLYYNPPEADVYLEPPYDIQSSNQTRMRSPSMESDVTQADTVLLKQGFSGATRMRVAGPSHLQHVYSESRSQSSSSQSSGAFKSVDSEAAPTQDYPDTVLLNHRPPSNPTHARVAGGHPHKYSYSDSSSYSGQSSNLRSTGTSHSISEETDLSFTSQGYPSTVLLGRGHSGLRHIRAATGYPSEESGKLFAGPTPDTYNHPRSQRFSYRDRSTHEHPYAQDSNTGLPSRSFDAIISELRMENKVLRAQLEAYRDIISTLKPAGLSEVPSTSRRRDSRSQRPMSPFIKPSTTQELLPLAPYKPLKQENYPRITFWYKSEWQTYKSENKSDGDIGNRGRALSSQGVNVMSPFIEHENGSAVNGHILRDMRSHARAIWMSLDKIGRLPPTWGKADAETASQYRSEMREKFIALRLCDNDWKADQIATDTYSSWYKSHREHKARQVKEEPADDIVTPLNKRSSSVLGSREEAPAVKKPRLTMHNPLLRPNHTAKPIPPKSIPSGVQTANPASVLTAEGASPATTAYPQPRPIVSLMPEPTDPHHPPPNTDAPTKTRDHMAPQDPVRQSPQPAAAPTAEPCPTAIGATTHEHGITDFSPTPSAPITAAPTDKDINAPTAVSNYRGSSQQAIVPPTAPVPGSSTSITAAPTDEDIDTPTAISNYRGSLQQAIVPPTAPVPGSSTSITAAPTNEDIDTPTAINAYRGSSQQAIVPPTAPVPGSSTSITTAPTNEDIDTPTAISNHHGSSQKTIVSPAAPAPSSSTSVAPTAPKKATTCAKANTRAPAKLRTTDSVTARNLCAIDWLKEHPTGNNEEFKMYFSTMSSHRKDHYQQLSKAAKKGGKGKDANMQVT